MPRPQKPYCHYEADIPANLDVFELCENTDKDPQKICAFFHLFYTARLRGMKVNKSFFRNLYQSRYINIHSKHLKQIFGNNYRLYLIFLEEKGVIEIYKDEILNNKKYSPGHHSQFYRLTKKYYEAEGKDRNYKKQVIVSHTVIKKLVSNKLTKSSDILLNDSDSKKKINLNSKDFLAYADIFKCARNFKLNTDAYLPFLRNWKENINEWPLNKDGRKRPIQEFLHLMDRINEKQLQFSIDPFGKRLHSDFTNLWKGLRKHLYLESQPDEPLVNIDISNAQPFFSSIAVNQDVILQLIPDFAPCIKIFGPLQNTSDYKNFASSCANGNIYEEWMEEMNVGREEAKLQLLRIMYKSRRNDPDFRNVEEKFNRKYPSIAKAYSEIKKMKDDELPILRNIYLDRNGNFEAKGFHRNHALMMQRIESTFVLLRICPQLIKAGYTDFITIHDSIILKKNCKDEAIEIIKKEFEKLKVLSPQIKIEIL